MLTRQFAAGGVVVKEEHGKLYVLLIKDSYGRWTWAKGHIEKGEKPEEAAIREVCEETGLKNLKVIEKLGKQEYFFTLKGQKIFKTVYVFLIRADAKEKLTVQTAEIQDAKWFPSEKAVGKIEYKGSSDFVKKALLSLRAPTGHPPKVGPGRSNLKRL